MNNQEAIDALAAKRTSINAALRGLSAYREDFGAPSATVKVRQRDQIKTDALDAGVDLSTWDGKEAPVPAEA